jgi:hypothetical protein
MRAMSEFDIARIFFVVVMAIVDACRNNAAT